VVGLIVVLRGERNLIVVDKRERNDLRRSCSMSVADKFLVLLKRLTSMAGDLFVTDTIQPWESAGGILVLSNLGLLVINKEKKNGSQQMFLTLAADEFLVPPERSMSMVGIFLWRRRSSPGRMREEAQRLLTLA